LLIRRKNYFDIFLVRNCSSVRVVAAARAAVEDVGLFLD
jgi:hypothetical protein